MRDAGIVLSEGKVEVSVTVHQLGGLSLCEIELAFALMTCVQEEDRPSGLHRQLPDAQFSKQKREFHQRNAVEKRLAMNLFCWME